MEQPVESRHVLPAWNHFCKSCAHHHYCDEGRSRLRKLSDQGPGVLGELGRGGGGGGGGAGGGGSKGFGGVFLL